jgi:dTDP-4-amino-4,6-dideoxygalactose transaminase
MAERPLKLLARRPDPIPFARPDVGDAEIADVIDVMRSGWLTTGPRVQRFERAFAEYIGVEHAVALSSCTAALHLSLLALGVGGGDDAATTPLSFCATANVILHVGARPLFVDVDRAGLMDPAALAATITPRTRAVMPVHYAGRPADLDAIRAAANGVGASIVEDAAHCVEGAADGRKVGSSGEVACFSFYATKNLTTGEGGMATTRSAAIADWIRTASLHGMSRDGWSRYRTGQGAHYDVVMPGFKYNMTDLQAAIGLRQLARLPAMHARREALWTLYDEALAGLPIERPAATPPGMVHGRHLYTVLIDERECGMTRDALMEALAARGVQTSLHFRALHLHPYYAERYGFVRGMYPNAEYISDRTLSLPFSSALTDAEALRTADALRDLLA